MVLGRRAFGRWLGHKSGALMNDISAFMKKTPESSPTPSSIREHSKKMAILWICNSHQTPHLFVPWPWTSQPPKLWEINVFKSLSLWYFCFSRPKELRQAACDGCQGGKGSRGLYLTNQFLSSWVATSPIPWPHFMSKGFKKRRTAFSWAEC